MIDTKEIERIKHKAHTEGFVLKLADGRVAYFDKLDLLKGALDGCTLKEASLIEIEAEIND